MPRWAQHPGLTLCWANHPCTLPACLGWARHPPCTAAARTAAARGLALPLRAGPGAGKARGKLTSGNRRQAACPRWRGTGRTPCPPAHAQRVTPYTSTRNLAALGQQQQGQMVADLLAWRARCRGWRQVLSRLGIGLLSYQQAEAAGMANAGLGGGGGDLAAEDGADDGHDAPVQGQVGVGFQRPQPATLAREVTSVLPSQVKTGPQQSLR